MEKNVLIAPCESIPPGVYRKPTPSVGEAATPLVVSLGEKQGSTTRMSVWTEVIGSIVKWKKFTNLENLGMYHIFRQLENAGF